MKKTLLLLGVVLLFISSFPIFLYARENIVWERLDSRYEVIPVENFVSPTTLLNRKIELVETPTGQTVEDVYFTEQGMQQLELFSLQLIVDGKELGSAIDVVHDDYTPYYTTVALFVVKERRTKEQRVAIVQRVSPNDTPMNERAWRVTWLDEDGGLEQVDVPYAERSQHLLETRLINSSGTALMSIGFYSDVKHFWPTLFFPILYPGGTLIVGIVLLIAACVAALRERKGAA